MRGRLLIVDDEKALLLALRGVFKKEGWQVETASSGEEAVRKIKPNAFDVVLTDLSLGTLSGMDVLAHARAEDAETSVVMITAYGSEKVAVEAMKKGAEDYVPKPFDNEEMRIVLRRVMQNALLKREHRRLLEQVQGSFAEGQIVGRSAAMHRVFSMIEKVADTDINVLVRGESGTGKELVANALHYRSPRRNRALIKMNCAALSRELVESELFGHEKGSFTGATSRREGKFEAAHGGTLFLDEVGDMPLETQAKLLRAVQEKEFERVGGNIPVSVDVRLIAATNQDLEKMVAEGTFREDLYYRLKVVEIGLPALRERRDDIPLLLERFLSDAAERMSRAIKPLTGDALRLALEHPWPGNVRELRSAVEQALLLANGDEITAADLLGAPEAPVPSAANGKNTQGEASTFRDAKDEVVSTFEKRFLLEALRRTGGNITRAAENVGMYRQSFQQKMRELGLSAEDAKNGEGE
ncbi:MAG: sigma-54 dependent transcriptional regulator [Deltaproteobacteria bacterium]